MADTVSTRVILDDDHNYGIFLSGVTDGSGESTVTKVTLSAVHTVQSPTTRLPIQPVALDLVEVYWSSTYTTVDILWKATTNDRIFRLFPTGFGHQVFTGRGSLVGDTISAPGLQTNIAATGYTGDILLTSTGTSGEVYNITLWFRKRLA